MKISDHPLTYSTLNGKIEHVKGNSTMINYNKTQMPISIDEKRTQIKTFIQNTFDSYDFDRYITHMDPIDKMCMGFKTLQELINFNNNHIGLFKIYTTPQFR